MIRHFLSISLALFLVLTVLINQPITALANGQSTNPSQQQSQPSIPQAQFKQTDQSSYSQKSYSEKQEIKSYTNQQTDQSSSSKGQTYTQSSKPQSSREEGE